jgi:diguanylate cyclase (GGDEF)-like protein/PAS domain S-box-containing protein
MAVFILVGSMLVMFLRINRKNLLLFENASELQEQLIQQRTEELSQANELLQSEIGERNNSNRALRESEQYLQEITAALGEGLFVTDLNGVITYANPAVSQLLGWQEVELLGRCSHELLHHHTRDGEPFPKEDCHIMRAMKQGETIDKQEECFWTKKGGPLPIEVISTPIIRDDFVYGSVVAFRDITDSLDAQEALRQSEGRLRGIMDVLPDLMFLVDERGEIIEILTGVDFLMEIGSTYPFAMNIFDAFPAAPAGQLKKVIDDTIAVGKPQLIEYKEHKYAKDRWFEGRTALTGLTIDDNKAVVFIARDITEKKSAQEELQRLNRELEYQARSDPLTGTANRRYIMEQGKRLSSLVKRNGGDLSIIIFDLDGFKSVNDKYGHDIGDRVLKTVADKVEQGIREIDILGRWGGEEFIILCQQTNLAEAVHLAGRLRKILDMSIIDPIGKMTASFGVAASHGNESLEQTIHRADQALYAAKHAGRNRVFSNNRGQNELLSA